MTVIDLRDRWATLESGRVIGLSGVTLDDLEDVADRAPDGPFSLHYLISSDVVATVPQTIVDLVIEQLRSIARDLVQMWLPAGTAGTDVDEPALDGAAHEVAVATDLSAQVTLAVVRWCVGVGTEPDLPPAIAVRTYAALVARAYGRRTLVLTVSRTHEDSSGTLSRAQQDLLAHAFAWLAGRGGLTVVLVDDPLPLIDRFRTADTVVAAPATSSTIGRHRQSTGERARGAGLTAVIRPISGRVNPASDAEKAVEAALQRADWSTGRRCNVLITTAPLEPAARVDIAWESERVVVEIDGAEHRRARKYEDDRSRDNRLHCAGWTVLRFTNEQVDHDVAAVVSTIESLVCARRVNGPIGSTMSEVSA